MSGATRERRVDDAFDPLCEEIGINPAWNFLYGFPGEDPAEYARIAGLIPSLTHLPPVWGIWIVDIHRFSPFFERPAAYGFTRLRPGAAYRHVYPLPEAQLRRLAYFFDYDRADGLDSDDYTAEAQTQLLEWRAHYRNAALDLKVCKDHLQIRDTRNGTGRIRILDGAAMAAYLALDSGATAKSAQGDVESRLGKTCSMRQLQSWLDEWESDRLVMREEHRYLSLAVNLAERVRMPGEHRPNRKHIGGPAGYWPSV